jgi:GntR family transcriptional regulator, transcriptional repressor for pyruvate dehydrogenase complex
LSIASWAKWLGLSNRVIVGGLLVDIERRSGSIVIELRTTQSVRSLIRVWIERGLNDSDHAHVACVEHRAVLDALRGHDANAAASTMSTHMDTARHRLLGFLDTSAA